MLKLQRAEDGLQITHLTSPHYTGLTLYVFAGLPFQEKDIQMNHTNAIYQHNLLSFILKKKKAVAVVIVAFRGVYLQSDEEMLSE